MPPDYPKGFANQLCEVIVFLLWKKKPRGKVLLVGVPCVQVYRGNRWLKMSSEELLPGDIVSVGELLTPLQHVLQFQLAASFGGS